jgi:hypothetical protein
MMTKEHQAATRALRDIREARGQETDSDQSALATLNTLCWALRRQAPEIDPQLRERAQAAADALKMALGA